MKIISNGKVLDDGKLHINNKKLFLKDLQMFAGKDIKITVERKYRKRSNAQNNAYWGYVLPMTRHGLVDVGYKLTLAQAHDFLKNKFLKKELVSEDTGEVLESIKSTSELSTSEFMDYIAEIQQFGAEYLNIQIPEPGEQGRLEV